MRYDTSSCPPVFSHSSSPSRSPLWGPALGPLPCARRRRRARASKSGFRRRRAPSRSRAWSTSRSAATTSRTPIEQASPTGVAAVLAVTSTGSRRARRSSSTHARPRIPGSEPARHPGRRLLDAAVRQRLHAVPSRRRQDRLAAHGSMGRTELEALAGQSLRRSGEGHLRPAVQRRRSASSPTR